jgi:hypothetical protein
MVDPMLKKDKLLYFPLAYSTGKYFPSNSGVIPVSCGVLFAGLGLGEQFIF